jgi:hypothetical protein
MSDILRRGRRSVLHILLKRARSAASRTNRLPIVLALTTRLKPLQQIVKTWIFCQVAVDGKPLSACTNTTRKLGPVNVHTH